MTWIDDNKRPLMAVGAILGVAWFGGRYFDKNQSYGAESEDCEVCYTTVDKGTLNDVQAGRICNECHRMNQYTGGTRTIKTPYNAEKKNCGCGKDPCKTYGAETFAANTMDYIVLTSVSHGPITSIGDDRDTILELYEKLNEMDEEELLEYFEESDDFKGLSVYLDLYEEKNAESFDAESVAYEHSSDAIETFRKIMMSLFPKGTESYDDYKNAPKNELANHLLEMWCEDQDLLKRLTLSSSYDSYFDMMQAIRKSKNADSYDAETFEAKGDCAECYGTGGLYDSHMGINDECHSCGGTGFDY